MVALVLVLNLVAVPAAAPGAVAQGLDDRISDVRQRQAALQRAIDRQKQQLQDVRSDQSVAQTALGTTDRSLDGINADQAAIRKDIAQATDAINKVQARRDGLRDELRQLDWTLSLLQQEIADGDRELDQRRRLLGERLAEAYRAQNTSLLEQVLADQSFSDVLTAANAYLSYGDQDAQLAQHIAADQRALDSLRALTTATRYRTDQLRRDTQHVETELHDQKARLARAKEKLLTLEQETEAVRDIQLAQFRKFAGNAKKQAEMVARKAAAERKLDKQISSLVAEAKRRAEAAARAARAARAAQNQNNGGGGGGTSGGGGGLGEGSGSFSWPTSGIVTQEFGCTGFALEPPRGSCAHFHDGIDIANGQGTPVRAPANGVIAFVGWNPFDSSDPSFMVVIGHAGGYESRFMHLESKYAVRAGQTVQKGQLIGYMGNTGNSTGAHLHWEIYRGNTPVNPRGLV